MHLAYPDPVLSDGEVTLRPWSESDLACVEEAATDPRIPAGTTVPATFTTTQGLAFVHRQQRRIHDGEGISLAVTLAGSDRAVGLLWLPLRPQPGVVGLGYWLVPSVRGRGIGTRAVRMAADWALGSSLAQRVEAWVEPDNVGSQRLLAAAGLEREGILRGFLSVAGGRSDAVVFSRTASTRASSRTDLAALERRRLAAIVQADREVLEALHHDDFVLCTPSGVVWDRVHYLDGLTSGAISYARFEPEGEIEVLTSGDLATLRYRSVIDVAVPGGGGHLECWHLDVYVRDHHGWRCRWSQATDTILD